MKLLLDTHALLWTIFSDPRLGKSTRTLVEEADELAYSTVSLWEIGIKLSNGGFDLAMPQAWHELIPKALQSFDVREIGIQAKHCRIIQDLPYHHRDPFDRMLIAQAKSEEIAILSKDKHFEDYGVDVLW